MDFVALDVETANSDMSSICQIGIAKYSSGQLLEEWSSLINPEDYFDPINISIHGISDTIVACSPTLPKIFDTLRGFLNNSICVSHGHFDRVSLERAFVKYGINEIKMLWLDSAKVARRTWEECAWSGYGLLNLCKRIGYEFKHHDALEDAKASGQVLIAAMEKSGLDINTWLERVESPINQKKPSPSRGNEVNRFGNPEGELYGEELVFTGSLEIARGDAADLAASIGCRVAQNVTKKTSILVVGNQDVAKLAGKDKSAKHRKAEQLILNGQRIRIIKESDFKELVKLTQNSV